MGCEEVGDGQFVSGWTKSDSCCQGTESKPRDSRKEKVNAVLEDLVSRPEDDLGGLLVFSEAKHTEMRGRKRWLYRAQRSSETQC